MAGMDWKLLLLVALAVVFVEVQGLGGSRGSSSSSSSSSSSRVSTSRSSSSRVGSSRVGSSRTSSSRVGSSRVGSTRVISSRRSGSTRRISGSRTGATRSGVRVNNWKSVGASGGLFGYSAYQTRRLYHNDPYRQPTICRNTHEYRRPNGSYYQMLICPLEEQTDWQTSCCGPSSYRQYCC